MTKTRPWDDVTEMDEEMAQRWNAKVREHNKVYMLDDIVINCKSRFILGHQNKDKVLIKGNHLIFDYTCWPTIIYKSEKLSTRIKLILAIFVCQWIKLTVPPTSMTNLVTH